MLAYKEIDAMDIAFDFSNPFAIARVPQNFRDAETFALDFVYFLGPYVANKLDTDYSKVVLVAISKNNISKKFKIGRCHSSAILR